MLFIVFLLTVLISEINGNCVSLKINAKYFFNQPYFLSTIIKFLDPINRQQFISVDPILPSKYLNYSAVILDGKEFELGDSIPVYRNLISLKLIINFNNQQIISYPLRAVIDVESVIFDSGETNDAASISLANGEIIDDEEIRYGTQHVKNSPAIKIQFSRQCLQFQPKLLPPLPYPSCNEFKNTIILLKGDERLGQMEVQLILTSNAIKVNITKNGLKGTTIYGFNNYAEAKIIPISKDNPQKIFFTLAYSANGSDYQFITGKLILRNIAGKLMTMQRDMFSYKETDDCFYNNVQSADITRQGSFCCTEFSTTYKDEL